MKKRIVLLMISLMTFLALCTLSCSQTTAPTTSSVPTSKSAPSTSAVATGTPTQVQQTVSGDVIKLAFNLRTAPIQDRWKFATAPWVEEVQKRSGGRIQIVPYFSGALSAPEDVFQSLLSGQADLAEGVTTLEPGRFPLHDYAAAANHIVAGNKTSIIYWKTEQAIPELAKEFAGVKILCMFASTQPDGMMIATKTKPILKLEDAKGLKLQAGGVWATEKLKTLGFSVVGMSMDDVYMSIQNGVIDGASSDWNLQSARKWADVTGHITSFQVGGSPFYYGMCQKTYDKLPADLKKVIDDVSGEFLANWMDDKLAVANQACKDWAMKEKKVQFHILAADELARWEAAIAPTEAAWVKQTTAKGLPAQKTLDEYYRIQKSYEGK